MDPVGLLAVLAGVAVFVFRLFGRKAKAQPEPAPPVNAPAERARATIREDGDREVSSIMEDLKTSEAMERLAERADRRRRDRK